MGNREDEEKFRDKIVDSAMKGIFALASVACSIIFYSMSGNIDTLLERTQINSGRLYRVETQLEERKAADERRDRAIEEIQSSLRQSRQRN